MFGVNDQKFLENGIKIIDGIAGGGKSSLIDNFFKSQDQPYSRLTSTNRLRRDAEDRYNMKVKTIAAGLFSNKNGRFYSEEKEAPSKNVVIDEILQTTPKAIDWCRNHADNTNIIITTDSRQLMSPENETAMRQAFDALANDPNVVYANITETLRARNAETKALYEEFYGIADSELLFDIDYITHRFNNVISYKDLDYNTHDAFVTHDNLTEDFLYKDKQLASMPFLDLIPKGFISSTPPKDLSKYPVLSQLSADSTHTNSYTQVMNIGTPVRFQGSEVTTDQKLFYLLQPTSLVSARELYTVITRMWDINSFNIVLIDTPKPFILKTFNGLPVKTHKVLSIDATGDTVALSDKEMEALVSKYDTDDIYYDRDAVRTKIGYNKFIRKDSHQMSSIKRKSTAASLAKRDSALNYSYMDKVYDIIQAHDVVKLKAIHKFNHKQLSGYEIDLFSAHPTMLKYEKMPADGILKTDGPHDDMLNFYIYSGSVFTDKSIITDDMNNYILSHNLGTTKYLFSTPYKVGTYPGNYLHKKAHDTKESKQEIKEIHYGYYQKPYITKAPNGTCYVRWENHIYELLICQIFSQLTFYMMQLYEKLNGSSIVIDAVKFPCYTQNEQKLINSVLPSYIDYRVRTDGGKVLYQTYKDLPTKAEKKTAQNKARYNALTPEEKYELNKKRREAYKKKKEENS